MKQMSKKDRNEMVEAAVIEYKLNDDEKAVYEDMLRMYNERGGYDNDYGLSYKMYSVLDVSDTATKKAAKESTIKRARKIRRF